MELGSPRRKLAVTAALLACLSLLVLRVFLLPSGEIWTQRLDDGSHLALTRVKFGTNNCFPHGNPVWRAVEALIPEHFGTAGFQFQVQQPDNEYVSSSDGRPLLAAEFHLVSTNTAKLHPLADPDARWQFRWVVRGEAGMDYVEEFTAFWNYQDGRFDYLVSSRFPRDSKWVAFRLERRMTRASPWRAMANFRVKNPSHPETKPWSAEATPVVKRAKGMEFTLGEVTLGKKPVGNPDPLITS